MSNESADSPPSLRRSIVAYTSATVFCRVAAVVQSVILLRWMEPADLGIWLGLQLILIYGAHAHCGVFNAVNRQIPFHRGRGDFERAESIERVARGWLVLLTAFGLAAALWMTVAGIADSDRGRGAIALLTTTVLMLGVQFHEGLFRARKEFGRAGFSSVVNATIILAGLPLVYVWRYDGLLVRAVLAAILTLVACLAMNRWTLRASFDWSETLALVRVGVPIMVVVLCGAAFASLDRTMILWLLDEQAMGHYALCFAVARVMYMFPTTFGQIFYPRLTELYAAEGISGSVLRGCVYASLLSVGVVTLMALCILALLPWVVEQFFDRYAPGLPALRIAMIAYVIYALAAGPTYFLISTMQKRRQLVALAAGTATLALLALWIVPRTLEGIAWSLAGGTVVYVAGLWTIVAASARRAQEVRI